MGLHQTQDSMYGSGKWPSFLHPDPAIGNICDKQIGGDLKEKKNTKPTWEQVISTKYTNYANLQFTWITTKP